MGKLKITVGGGCTCTTHFSLDEKQTWSTQVNFSVGYFWLGVRTVSSLYFPNNGWNAPLFVLLYSL